MNQHINLFELISKNLETDRYRELNWNGSFHDYLQIAYENPDVLRSAFQRIYDMICTEGSEPSNQLDARDVSHWNFFDDPVEKG